MTARDKKEWSAEECLALRQCYDLDWTDASIAALLQRTRNAVKVKRNEMGLSRAKHRGGDPATQAEKTRSRARQTPAKPSAPVDFGAGFGGQNVREKRGVAVRISAAVQHNKGGSTLA